MHHEKSEIAVLQRADPTVRQRDDRLNPPTPNVTLAYVEYRVNVALTPIHVRSNVTLAVGNGTLLPEWGPLPETWWPNLA